MNNINYIKSLFLHYSLILSFLTISPYALANNGEDVDDIEVVVVEQPITHSAKPVEHNTQEREQKSTNTHNTQSTQKYLNIEKRNKVADEIEVEVIAKTVPKNNQEDIELTTNNKPIIKQINHSSNNDGWVEVEDGNNKQYTDNKTITSNKTIEKQKAQNKPITIKDNEYKEVQVPKNYNSNMTLNKPSKPVKKPIVITEDLDEDWEDDEDVNDYDMEEVVSINGLSEKEMLETTMKANAQKPQLVEFAVQASEVKQSTIKTNKKVTSFKELNFEKIIFLGYFVGGIFVLFGLIKLMLFCFAKAKETKELDYSKIIKNKKDINGKQTFKGNPKINRT